MIDSLRFLINQSVNAVCCGRRNEKYGRKASKKNTAILKCFDNGFSDHCSRNPIQPVICFLDFWSNSNSFLNCHLYSTWHETQSNPDCQAWASVYISASRMKTPVVTRKMAINPPCHQIIWRWFNKLEPSLPQTPWLSIHLIMDESRIQI